MLLSKKQVTEMVLYGSAHIDRLENEESPYYDPSFPKPVKIGNNRVGWLKAEVEDFIRSKLEQRDSSH